MSTQRKPEFVEDTISEQAVAAFLVDNPDFFERHRTLLGTLQLPHATGGTVSLVERQVSMLRQKELKAQRRLKELIAVARDNDVLFAKIHRLSIRLLAARDLRSSIVAVEEAMRSGFGADQSVLVHFGEPALFADIDAGRFFRVVDRGDAALKPFATFLEGDKPRCGRARDSQRQRRTTRIERPSPYAFLVGQHTIDINLHFFRAGCVISEDDMLPLAIDNV